MCLILCLFSALSRRVGALQFSLLLKSTHSHTLNKQSPFFPATALDKQQFKKMRAPAHARTPPPPTPHTRNTCQAFYLEIRRISSIRHYLAHNALKTVICAFVCLVLITTIHFSLGAPQNLICKLQKFKIILPVSLVVLQGLTTYLRSFVLPVKSRILYKFLLLTFKSLNNEVASYLSDLIQLYVPSRQLYVPSCQLRSSADTPIPSSSIRSPQVFWSTHLLLFYQAPLLWNNLPCSLRHSSSRCNRVYCIHVPGHDPITFSFRSFSFLIGGGGGYGPII